VPRVLRVVPLEVRPELVAEAIAWLDERWRGGVFVPDELLPLRGGVSREGERLPQPPPG
jgi:hypothetical protein